MRIVKKVFIVENEKPVKVTKFFNKEIQLNIKEER